jgi:UDP-2,4-diacetamido-2,4,6-trideoxy-beta-L-altropyranose hydrolase
MQHIAIRVDASNQIGTGHFMRCLTLANTLKKRGAKLRFVSRYLPDYFFHLLKQNGHEFVRLFGESDDFYDKPLAHSHWLGVSQNVDALESLTALSDRTWDWLIVDHYSLDKQWENVLRRVTQNILVIDDIADRKHDCDVLMDQNYYSDMHTRYVNKIPLHCRQLLGPRYALLRDEFRLLRKKTTLRVGSIRRVLVFFGGIDIENYTGLAIDALVSLEIKELHIDVVIGAQHPHKEAIQSICAKHLICCHVQTAQVAELMAAADLAIGAGGSATWERCCLGVPTFAMCTAGNQLQQLDHAASEGFLYFPEIKEDFLSKIKMHLTLLFDNDKLRQLISSNAMRAVDGQGVLRVATIMGCTDIVIRLAIQSDAEMLFQCRNHPEIRKFSSNQELITWDDHQRWFGNALSTNKHLFLIGERAGLPMGVVRFDISGSRADISIYLVPEVKESGIGRELMFRAEEFLSQNRPEISLIHAHILGDNQRSINFFIGAGYKLESLDYLKRLH